MSVSQLTAALLLLAACASEPATHVTRTAEPVREQDKASSSVEPAQPAHAAVRRVDPSLVCMVNNQYMGKAQIPVEVAGKTYFGCCEMCKTRLAQDPQSRAALDPISGATVDKAMAVIGREPSGAVVYFENEANLQRYAAR